MANKSVNSLANRTLTEPGGLTGTDWQVPHLLRRAGFGATPNELSDYRGFGVSVAISKILNYMSIPDSNSQTQPDITMSYSNKPTASEISSLIMWWVNRMVTTPRPLEEKMTLFWHNHFATAIYKVRSPYLMYKQNQLLRTKAMGNFEDLLMGVTEDPAMLIWLDGARNRKGVANENYAREVMEVFTTGRGHYTEDDVKAGARAFTGYALDKNGETVFNPKLHDDGTKTLLGQTGNFGPKDIVHILANHPATARSLANQLFEYFAYPNPLSAVIDRLADTYLKSGGNIRAVVESILRSDEFMSPQAYMSQVKSPIEYVVSALRSLGATVKPALVVGTLRSMGQLPFDPPSVFGWPSGTAWINTSTMLDRVNFPLSLQDSANVPQVSSATDSVNSIAHVLLPDGLPQPVIQVIQNANNTLTSASDKLRNTIRLTMASPFYNLN